MSEQKSILKDKPFQFALSIIKLFKYLTEGKRKLIMSKQALRFGTSIGANNREAQNVQSKADFIHKLSISQKECDEIMYWLELLHQSNYLPEIKFKLIYSEANEILKMLRSAIITSKGNNL